MIKTHYLNELKNPDKYIKKEQKNTDVKRIQDWINLWKFYDSNRSL